MRSMARIVLTKWFWCRLVLALITLSLVPVDLLASRPLIAESVQALCIVGIVVTSVADARLLRRRSTK